jgi:hypothetical protein
MPTAGGSRRRVLRWRWGSWMGWGMRIWTSWMSMPRGDRLEPRPVVRLEGMAPTAGGSRRRVWGWGSWMGWGMRIWTSWMSMPRGDSLDRPAGERRRAGLEATAGEVGGWGDSSWATLACMRIWTSWMNMPRGDSLGPM